MTLKYRTKKHPEKCDIARCRQPLFEAHVYPDGERWQYCRDHGHEAAKENCHTYFDVEPLVDENGAALVTQAPAAPATAPVADLGTGEVVTPELIAQIQAERDRAKSELAELSQIEILTADDESFGNTELARVRAAYKALAAKEETVTKPLKEAMDGVRTWFRPGKKALKALEAGWTGALGKYRLRCEAQKQEALRLAQEAAAQVEAIKALPPAETPAQAAEAAQAVQELRGQARDALVAAAETGSEPAATYIDRWRFEVIDAAAVPREYLCPDVKAIEAVVKAQGAACTIPGIRVWNDPIVRTK